MLSRPGGCEKQVTKLPILHMSQSLTLYDNISFVDLHDDEADGELEVDPPMKINLETRITCVKPRTIGTFVTSVTTYHQSGKCIGTSKMMALIMDLNPEKIIPFDEAHMSSKMKKDDERIIDGSRIKSNDQAQRRKRLYDIKYQKMRLCFIGLVVTIIRYT